jgi:hypothetical protein
MRQVFTSPRLENVEAVAELLRAEGIEVRISNDRSYRGNRRRNFSYRDPGEGAGPQPAVWIVNADDQPRGRQLLRDAGLIESSRGGESSYLPLPALDGGGARTGEAGKRGRMRIRLVLLGLIGIVGLLIAFTLRDKPAPPPAPAAATAPAAKPAPVIVPQSTEDLQVFRVDVPGALAKLLVETELAKNPPAQACISIDDRDPSPAFMQALRHAPGTEVFAGSACPGDIAYDINVHDYMTDGSGRGEVQLMLDVEDARTLDVEREGERWRVLGTR